MKKTYKIVILSTNDKTTLVLNNTGDKLGEFYDNSHAGGSYKSQHLYILSDEEIKEGDWVYNSYFDRNTNYQPIQQFNGIETSGLYHFYSGKSSYISSINKIISSTDKSLNLPTIPEEYLKYFIEEYNKGNKLEKIELKMQPLTDGQLEWYDFPKIENNQVCPVIPIQDDVLDSIDPDEWDDGSDPANKDQSIVEAAEKNN